MFGLDSLFDDDAFNVFDDNANDLLDDNDRSQFDDDLETRDPFFGYPSSSSD